MSDKILYFVHCVDTEGPLYESLKERFKMINAIYDVNIEATQENLIKLQKKEICLNGKEDAIAKFLSPERLNLNEDWNCLEQHIDYITQDNFRNKYKDDFGEGWIYSWFVLDHVGFNDKNPRRRSLGDHIVYDFYSEKVGAQGYKDDLQWHYHPISIKKDANACGTSFLNGANIYEILAKKIIDRYWFPAVYRPGFHTERPDMNWFLEQWIPFDYGNQSINLDENQPDLAYSRFGDWKGAPSDWSVYSPSIYDWRKKGDCKRKIARCLNIGTRIRNIDYCELEKAFEKANVEGDVIVAVTNHDFRKMDKDIDEVYSMLQELKSKYPEVKIKFGKARNQLVNYLKINEEELILEVEKVITKENNIRIKIKSNGKHFGIQPFFAIKTFEGNYYWENLDFSGENEWSYIFDDINTLNYRAVEKIGVAMNSSYGEPVVKVLEL